MSDYSHVAFGASGLLDAPEISLPDGGTVSLYKNWAYVSRGEECATVYSGKEIGRASCRERV